MLISMPELQSACNMIDACCYVILDVYIYYIYNMYKYIYIYIRPFSKISRYYLADRLVVVTLT